MVGFGSDSRYRRTARARSSSGYFFGAATELPPHDQSIMLEKLHQTGGNSLFVSGNGPAAGGCGYSARRRDPRYGGAWDRAGRPPGTRLSTFGGSRGVGRFVPA